jgi:hypothetical protein
LSRRDAEGEVAAICFPVAAFDRDDSAAMRRMARVLGGERDASVVLERDSSRCTRSSGVR